MRNTGDSTRRGNESPTILLLMQMPRPNTGSHYLGNSALLCASQKRTVMRFLR